MTMVPQVTLARYWRFNNRKAPTAERPIGPPRLPDQFHPIGELARGGMCLIRFAQDITGTPVVLKTSLDPQHSHFVQKEGDALSGFDHPNLPYLLDRGYTQNEKQEILHWVAISYIDGDTLLERVSKGAIPLSESLKIIMQVASGLSAANAKGILHRDLKPENIMIDRNGVVKVIDFGLTRVDQPGCMVGTPGYISPEQMRADKVDHRSDIYSLGIIFHEMLSGRRAFNIGDPEHIDWPALLRDVEAGLPPLRLISLDLEKDGVQSLTQEFVRKLTAYRAEDRYQTYEAVIAAAQAIEARLAAFNAETKRELALLNQAASRPLTNIA